MVFDTLYIVILEYKSKGEHNMILTYEQIASIAQGVAYVEQNEEEIQFHRFTSAQEKGYDRSEFHPKQYATAGVRLHFKTDSKSLYVKVLTSRGSSRLFFAHDVLVNGEYIDSLKNDTEDSYGEFDKEFALGEGVKMYAFISRGLYVLC